MANGCFLGVGGVKEIKGCYVGIGGAVKEVVGIYGGVNSAVKHLWQNAPIVYQYTANITFTVSQTMTVDFFGVGGGGGGMTSGGVITTENDTDVVVYHYYAGGAGGNCITLKNVSLAQGDVIKIVIGTGGATGGNRYIGSGSDYYNGYKGGTTYIYKNGSLILTAIGGSSGTNGSGGDYYNITTNPYYFDITNRDQVIINTAARYTGSGGNARRERVEPSSLITKGTVGAYGKQAFGDTDGVYYGGGGGGYLYPGGEGGGAGWVGGDGVSVGTFQSVTPNSGGGGAGSTGVNSSGADGIVLMRRSIS